MSRSATAGTIAVVLFAALALGAAAGAASASPIDAPDAADAASTAQPAGLASDVAPLQVDDPAVEQDHEVRLAPSEPDTVYVDTTLAFANPASFQTYAVDASGDGYAIENATNLARDGSSSASDASTWTLEDGATTASFTAAIDVENASHAAATAEVVNATTALGPGAENSTNLTTPDAWYERHAAVVTLQLRERDRFEAANGSALAPDRERSVAIAGEGAVRGDAVLLGDYERRTGSWGGTTVEVLVSANATLSPAPDAIAESLRRADLTLPGRNANVSVLAVPGAIDVPSGGEEALVVEAGAPLAAADNAWLREYVRVTQRVDEAPDFAWFTDSYARYQAAKLSLEQGLANWSEFESHVALHPEDVTVANLSDPDTYGSGVEGADATAQGTVALLAMDADYRGHTYGPGTLHDQVANLERHEPVTVDEFLDQFVIGGLHAAPPARQYVLEPELPYFDSAYEHQYEDSFGYDPTAAPPDARIDVGADGEIDGAVLLNASTDRSEPGEGEIVSYRWRWGDGSTTSTERSYDRRLPQDPGRQAILVTVENEHGRTDTAAAVPNVSEGNAVAGGDVEWVSSEGSNHESGATVDGGLVFSGSGDGPLYAHDAATGDLVWTFPTSSSGVFSAPAVANGVVYAGTTDGTLYALDAATGGEIWAFTEPEDVHESSPVVTNGTVYVGGTADTLYAVDAVTGEREWTFTEPANRIRTSPVVTNGTVFVGASDDTLYAVDADTGEREWSFDELSEYPNFAYTAANGTLYVGGANSTLYALDTDTGDVEWTFDGASNGVDSTPTVADGTVFVGSGDDNLYALDAVTGERKWTYQATQDVNSPTVAGGDVYVSSIDARLHAIDAETGLRKWEYETGSYASHSPIVADGTVYFGNDDSFHAIDAGHDASSEGSRARLGTLGHVGDRGATHPQEQPVAVTGSVVDAQNGTPVGNATVRVGLLETTTDEDGAFALDLPPGEHEIVVEAADLATTTETVTVDANGTANGSDSLVVELASATPPVTVEGTEVRDVDDDGHYRDVTGDGAVGQADVAAFFRTQHRSEWKRPELFDFSENGAVTHGDVVELFDYVALQ